MTGSGLMAKLRSKKKGATQFRLAFKSLRWRLTLSYTLVTIAALLVVEVILIVLLMSYFTNHLDLIPENLISSLRKEWTPKVNQFFSKDPPDVEGLRTYLEDVQESVAINRPLLVLGNIKLDIKAQEFLNFYYILKDRTLVDAVPHDIVTEEELGSQIPYDYLPGLEEPLTAALDGIEDENLLYSRSETGNQIIGAIPVFRYKLIVEVQMEEDGSKNVMDVKRDLVGVIIFTTKRFPWDFLPWKEVVIYIARSLLFFTLFAGILGSIFGMITAGNLTKRLTKVSDAAHDWSRGDFSVIVHDPSNDEIGKLTSDLNSMAEQLENLLDRRQELSVLQERNRLARDLHDSVKQQAFAASAQLGAARSHFKTNPEESLSHMKEAEKLVSKVRQELTDLIQELRPIEMKGKGLVTAAEDYARDWSERNSIEIETLVRGERSLPVQVEKSIFRIIQEALANVAWHSHAEKATIYLDFRNEFLLLVVTDDGIGFTIDQKRKTGVGLQSMHERAELIGGELLVQSQIDIGTKVILKYPYQEMEL
jgi:signal transduction histidine kinase